MSRDPTRSLGAYMRAVGEALTDAPMTVAAAHDVISYIDEGYAAATLIRLRERGIADEIEGGFVRGPRWQDLASYYGWKR